MQSKDLVETHLIVSLAACFSISTTSNFEPEVVTSPLSAHTPSIAAPCCALVAPLVRPMVAVLELDMAELLPLHTRS